jgi:hypothetical protein
LARELAKVWDPASEQARVRDQETATELVWELAKVSDPASDQARVPVWAPDPVQAQGLVQAPVSAMASVWAMPPESVQALGSATESVVARVSMVEARPVLPACRSEMSRGRRIQAKGCQR